MYRAPSPLLGVNSIRAGTRPVTAYVIRAQRWVHTFVTNAPHLYADGRSQATRGRFYEGVCQPPYIQMFSGSVIVSSMSGCRDIVIHNGLQLLARR